MTALSALICCTNETEQQQAQVNLLSPMWSFDFPDAPKSAINTQNPAATIGLPADSTFTIAFTINIKDIREEEKVLEIPEIHSVILKNHDAGDRKRQNYPAYKMPDGSVPVLEARLSLQLPVEDRAIREMPVGIPLAMLDNPKGEHKIVLNFSGVQWTMYVDGELFDNDFPLGYPIWKESSSWNIDAKHISKAEIFFPAGKPERIVPDKPDVTPEIQGWTPKGHNAWVGDVATFYKDGRYHVFYLFDRRTHESKFGRGAHYFEHISTADFKTWTEHEAATPIEEQWETFGTGTPFMYDGKLCISYGLHTTRIYPAEQTTLPAQWDYYRANGRTGSFHVDTTAGFPAGSTYSISEDGITNFRKTGIMFHPCENPSVYTDPDGNLRMLANYGAKGTWGSKDIDGGWSCIDSVFPPGGDCTFFFRWGDYDYVIGGFSGLWSKSAKGEVTDYESVVKQGLDFYNGMSVPAVTEIGNNRFLIAGWIRLQGWGGTLNIHELIQLQDGRIGSKWMEEIIPKTGDFKTIGKKIIERTLFDTDNSSFMLTFDVHPLNDKESRFGLVFLPEDGAENARELQISPADKLAQYGAGSLTGFAAKEKSLRQGGSPHGARNYAIENLIDVDKPFTVRIMVQSTGKFGGSLIDTEIAGKRTMITFCPNLVIEKLLFNTENVEIKNAKISPL